MPQSAYPFILRDLTLELAVDSGATFVEYRCQLSRAELVPAAGTAGATEYVTFCQTHTSGGGGSLATWTLELSGFQAWTDVEDLSMLLFDNEGEIIDYRLVPAGGAPSATNIGFFGEVTAFPTQVGGTAAQYAQFTVSLPTTGKPSKQTAAWAATLAQTRAARLGREPVDSTPATY